MEKNLRSQSNDISGSKLSFVDEIDEEQQEEEQDGSSPLDNIEPLQEALEKLMRLICDQKANGNKLLSDTIYNQIVHCLKEFNNLVFNRNEMFIRLISVRMTKLWKTFLLDINEKTNIIKNVVEKFLQSYLHIKKSYDFFISGYRFTTLVSFKISTLYSISEHNELISNDPNKLLMHCKNIDNLICVLSYHGQLLINDWIMNKKIKFRNKITPLKNYDPFKEQIMKDLNEEFKRIQEFSETLTNNLLLKVVNSETEINDAIEAKSFPINHRLQLREKFSYFFLACLNKEFSIKFEQTNSNEQLSQGIQNLTVHPSTPITLIHEQSDFIIGDEQFQEDGDSKDTIEIKDIFQGLFDSNISFVLNNSSLEYLDNEFVQRIENQSPATSTMSNSIVFKSKKYLLAVANLHLVMEEGVLQMVDYLNTALFIIFNDSVIMDKIKDFTSNGGDINIVFNKLVKDLTVSAFEDYLSLDKIVAVIDMWTPEKKSQEKTNLRKRYSRAFRTVLKQLKIDKNDNSVVCIDKVENTKLMKKVLTDHLIPLFNSIPEATRIALVNTYTNEWNMKNGDFRSNVFSTPKSKRKIERVDYSGFGGSSTAPKNKRKKNLKSVDEKKGIEVYEVYDHRFAIAGDEDSIEFHVDLEGVGIEEGVGIKWTPLKPLLIENVVVFDYLRKVKLEHLIPEEFRSNSILKVLDHKPKHGKDFKNIKDVTFKVEREYSNDLTLENYNDILNSGQSLNIIDNYIEGFEFLKNLTKPMHRLLDNNNESNNPNNNNSNINNNNSNDNNESNNPNNNNSNSTTVTEESVNDDNYDDRPDKDSDQTVISYIISNKEKYFDNANQICLNNLIDEYNKSKKTSINSQVKNYSFVIPNKLCKGFQSILLDFYYQISCSTAEIKDTNKKIIIYELSNVIKRIKKSLSDDNYSLIIIQNSLTKEFVNGPINRSKDITLKIFLDMFEASTNSGSIEYSKQRKLAYYNFFIDNLIDLLNTIVYNSPLKQTLFLSSKFWKQYQENNFGQFKLSNLYKRIVQSDRLIIIKRDDHKNFDFLISVEFEDTLDRKTIAKISISVFTYHTDVKNINENAAAHKLFRVKIIQELSLSLVDALRYIYKEHYRNNFIIPGDNMDVKFYKGEKITDESQFSLVRSNTICGCLMIYSMYKLSAKGKTTLQDKFLKNENNLRTVYFHNLLLYYLVLNDTPYNLKHSYDSDDDSNDDSGDFIDIDESDNNSNNNDNNKNNDNKNDGDDNDDGDDRNNNNDSNNSKKSSSDSCCLVDTLCLKSRAVISDSTGSNSVIGNYFSSIFFKKF